MAEGEAKMWGVAGWWLVEEKERDIEADGGRGKMRTVLQAGGSSLTT